MARPGVKRDTTSGGLVNQDAVALQAYKARRQKQREADDAQANINTLEKRIKHLEEWVEVLSRYVLEHMKKA